MYYGFVTMVDECIGRVVRALKSKGLWDEAYVIVTQDHGDMLGEHHLMQKMCPYEPAAHVPLLIKPPRGAGALQQPNGTARDEVAYRRRAQLVSHVDFADTICDIAGIELLPGSQGRSYMPVLRDARAPWPNHTFMEHHGDQGRGAYWRAIVADVDGRRLKYIYTPGDVDELYDVTADPREVHSLVAESEYAGLRADLREQLFRWMRDEGDFLDPPD